MKPNPYNIVFLSLAYKSRDPIMVYLQGHWSYLNVSNRPGSSERGKPRVVHAVSMWEDAEPTVVSLSIASRQHRLQFGLRSYFCVSIFVCAGILGRSLASVIDANTICFLAAQHASPPPTVLIFIEDWWQSCACQPLWHVIELSTRLIHFFHRAEKWISKQLLYGQTHLNFLSPLFLPVSLEM